jgi:hypothetical protein
VDSDCDNIWPDCLLKFIRENSSIVFERFGRVLSIFDDEMMSAESFTEFCDVTGKLLKTVDTVRCCC